jgi:protein TonB
MSTAAFPSQANGSGPSGSGGGTTPAAATSPSYLSPAYLATVVSWLEQHKEYPDAARSRHDEGTVQIAFTIDRDGHVLSFEIRHSSGNAMLDQAAKDMIRRADPLPPPPASYLGPRLEMVLPLTFALR